MKLILLAIVVMVAFASNSLLTRVGVFTYGMDPLAFGTWRVAAGALMLAALVFLRGDTLPKWNPMRAWGALALTVYMIGFSWSYLKLDAGLGALILFGVMQVAMFAYAVMRKDTIPMLRWFGAGVALFGLIVLLWPGGQTAIDGPSAIAMAIAGIGWAAYTLLGQGAPDPLTASARNFVLCFPVVALVWALTGFGGVTLGGAVCAVLSGALASGLGYALWYWVVPQLSTSIAAVAQLSVPVIAVAAGVLLLGEPLTLRLVIAGALVLSGIGISVLRKG